MLQRVVHPSDLRIVCKNQERDAFGEVVATCGSVFEDSLRAAWRFFYEEGPPDEVARVEASLKVELKDSYDSSLNSIGIQKAYWTLRRAGFFKVWSEWRKVPIDAIADPLIETLVQLRNDVLHRRSQTLAKETDRPARVDRKTSRDLAKKTLHALRFLGQLLESQISTWIEQLSRRPKDPSVLKLPQRWYPELVGRQVLLEQLMQDLKSDEFRRIALEGVSGVGKSSIALELGQRAFADGVITQAIWVSGKVRFYSADGTIKTLPAISDGLAHVVKIILEGFSWAIQDGEDPAETALALLSDCERPLLVVDNWESLQHFEDLQEWLLGLPNSVKVLYTSRRGVTEARPRKIGGLDNDSTKRLVNLHLRDTPHWAAVANLPYLVKEIFEETKGNPLLVTMYCSVIKRNEVGMERDVSRALFKRARGRDLLEFMHDYNLEALSEQERLAFSVTPMLDQPVRVDWLATAMKLDKSTARHILEELVEVNLAELVIDPEAATVFTRERYRIHPFSLTYARRLLEAYPERRTTTNTRLEERRLEDEAAIQLLKDGGFLPANYDGLGDNAENVFSDVGHAYRDVLTRRRMDAIDELSEQLLDEVRETGWYTYVRYAAARHCKTPSVGQIEEELRQATAPHAPSEITWLVNDALERQKPEEMLRLLKQGGDRIQVDWGSVHRAAVEVGKQGNHELAEELHKKGLKMLDGKTAYGALVQRQYYMVGLATNLISWARKLRGADFRGAVKKLDEAEGHLRKCMTLPHCNRTIVDSKLDEIKKLRQKNLEETKLL